MRAVRVHRHGEPADALELDDGVPVPEPGPEQVRVRVEATALSMPDVMLCRGGYPLTPRELPFVPGMEGAGVVTALGAGVDPDWLGRRVVGTSVLPHGTLAEETLVRAGGLYPVPDGVTPAAAATTHIAFTTAHAGLHRRAGLRPGETLLVTAAAGGTGNAAVQLGAVAGARVIAVASGEARRRTCLELGADVALDPDEPDLAKAVLAANGGRGVDVVFEPVGGPLFTAATRCVASEGRIVVVGFAAGEEGAVRPGHLLRRNYTVMGIYMGAYSGGEENRRYMLAMHDEIMGLLASGRCRALIDRETDLAGAAQALTDLADRKVTGRPIVTP
jgi:NADPH:quinone reductase